MLEPLDAEALAAALDGASLDGGGAPSPSATCSPTSTPSTSWPTRDAARRARPGVPVSLSHEVAPIWREYERGTTVTVDAYLEAALRGLRRRRLAGAARRAAVAAPWSLLKSNGGHALAARGPGAARPISCSRDRRRRDRRRVGGPRAGARARVALDMGGTSCDVCLIVGGSRSTPPTSRSSSASRSACRRVSTRTIGAGGGSIGWVDPGGFLQVGPQSAGADARPGLLRAGGRRRHHGRQPRARPARPRLLPRRAAAARPPAGRAALDEARRAARARRRRGRLGDGAVANENMANAIRIVTVEQGIDPRELALVAFGGAGPTHAGEIADAMGMPARARAAEPGAVARRSARWPRRPRRRGAQRLPERRGRRPPSSAPCSPSSRSAPRPTSRPRARGRSPRSRRSARCATRARTTSRRSPVPGGRDRRAARSASTRTTPGSTRSSTATGSTAIPIELVRLSVVAARRRPVARTRLPEVRAPGGRRAPTAIAARSSSPSRGFVARRRSSRRGGAGRRHGADGPRRSSESMDSTSSCHRLALAARDATASWSVDART